MDKTNIPLETLFETYVLFNRSEGKSEETITWYDNKLHAKVLMGVDVFVDVAYRTPEQFYQHWLATQNHRKEVALSDMS